MTEIRSLPFDLILRVVDDARELFGEVTCSFTGGEPTLHPRWDDLIDALREREVQYRMVTNGWHMRRIMPSIDRHPPVRVRVSLSGATEEVHDEERGRGSFKRVQLAVALLTSRQIPTGLSMVIDKRDRHQIRQAADLAEALGCNWISFILPQPVPGSADRSSDLAPEEWIPIRKEIESIASESGRRTNVSMDYGAPSEGDESTCATMALERIYVDPDGRLSLCCQLSDYGFNTNDVVGDLTHTSLKEMYPLLLAGVKSLRVKSARPTDGSATVLDSFPCMRCARTQGKLDWLSQFPDNPWTIAMQTPAHRALSGVA